MPAHKAKRKRGLNTIFFLAMAGLIACGIVRSAIATHLDSFDIDEAYHITAGVSYMRLGDYRLNPEHPPLVKLWVGAFLPESLFYLPPLGSLADKIQERHFTADAVYLKNDPDTVQQRVRMAMFLLNGLLLLGFGQAVWHVFDRGLALAAIAFLVIDPTVAAHMPLALTDLPTALLASTALLLSFSAFQTWRARDLVLAGLVLGLAFAGKHSAPIVVAAVALLGILMTLRHRGALRDHIPRLVWVLAVLVVAWIVLWGFYRFRFNESAVGRDLFNRPLAEKIADINTPTLRKTVSLMSDSHVLPRAYLWGLADIIRAGVEGRVYGIYLWNSDYIRKTPFYFFPVLILVKLPIGLVLLSLVGLALTISGRVVPQWRAGLAIMIGLAAFLLLMLAIGNSSYAGIRHALPVFPPLAMLAAVTVDHAVRARSRLPKIGVALAAAVALLSAIPVMRPWEYYNEIAGGPANAFHHFNDEGLETGQRIKELAVYYHKVLKPQSIVPYLDYWLFFNDEELKRRGVRTMQMQWDEDQSTDTSDVVSGTLIVNAKWTVPDPWMDYPPLRSVQPAERFGNLLIYRGTFHLPKQRAVRLFNRALTALYSEKPDAAKAERLLREAVAVAPEEYFMNIELGNLLAHRGARVEAIRAYESAKAHAPVGESIVDLLGLQIERVSREDPKSVQPVRNPVME